MMLCVTEYCAKSLEVITSETVEYGANLSVSPTKNCDIAPHDFSAIWTLLTERAILTIAKINFCATFARTEGID